MNKRQKIFLFGTLSKIFMALFFFFGFWAFIYEFAWWNKGLLHGLLSAGVNWVLCPVCLLLWIIFETWAVHPEIIPSFRLERGSRRKKRKKEKRGYEEEPLEL